MQQHTGEVQHLSGSDALNGGTGAQDVTHVSARDGILFLWKLVGNSWAEIA